MYGYRLAGLLFKIRSDGRRRRLGPAWNGEAAPRRGGPLADIVPSRFMDRALIPPRPAGLANAYRKRMSRAATAV
jgi:hypothetical protein